MISRRDVLRAGGMAAIASRTGSFGQTQRPLPKSEYDYVDWSWTRWRDITGTTRPTLRTAQSSEAQLIDLLNPAGAKTAPAWAERRLAISSTLASFVGDPPRESAPFEAEMLEETRTASHLRQRIRFRAATGEWIPGYLLVPHRVRERGAPAPAVLCPHQTTQEGKREPAGVAGNPEQATAKRLAERGFITFTWDALCFGERHDAASGHYGDAIPFYERHPRWSLLGKMVLDLGRAIDYLQTVELVDRARIGCTGHSHGGITTIFGLALDPRVAAGASNCGFDTFRIDGNVWRWSHATALMPRLGFYVSSPYINMDRYRGVPDSEVIQVPFDLHEVLALAAPRPLLLSTSEDDFVFPNAGWSARMALARVRQVYSALGAGERLESLYFTGGHRLPMEVARHQEDWLVRVLRPS
jgi:dienelactone hydrolase